MTRLEHLDVVDGMCQFRPRGESSLVEAVELMNRAIAYCRDRNIATLFVDATGLVGVSVPSLVDRFLIAEEWAHEARSIVTVALVVHAEYIHSEKFAVTVARDFGLTLDVFTSETDALKWLRSVAAQT